MSMQSYFKLGMGLTFWVVLSVLRASTFEGYINAMILRGGTPSQLLYTVGTNFMRIEVTDTHSLNTIDVVDRDSGALTLIFSQSHCYMRLTAAPTSASFPPGVTGMPPPPQFGQPPQGLQPPQVPANGPANFPGLPGAAALSATPGIPPMPAMPAMPTAPVMPNLPSLPMMQPGGEMQLRATDASTNLLGYACTRYEIKQWGQTMEIWATDQLPPFQIYEANQPLRGGPPVIELRWGDLLAEKKLFPLLASLRLNNGFERYRFEVQSVTPAIFTNRMDKDFQVPPDYIELQPRPF